MSNFVLAVIIGFVAIGLAAKEIESLKDRVSDLEEKLNKLLPDEALDD